MDAAITPRLRKPKVDLNDMAASPAKSDPSHHGEELDNAQREPSERKPETVPTSRSPSLVQLPGVAWGVLKTALGCSYMNFLLPFVFLGIVSGIQGWDESVVFLLNFLAILPLASLLSFATEELAKSVGQTIGALINATFGNAVEIIVCCSRPCSGGLGYWTCGCEYAHVCYRWGLLPSRREKSTSSSRVWSAAFSLEIFW